MFLKRKMNDSINSYSDKAEHSEVRHGDRKGESPAVRNAEHSEVRHGDRKGESPAVRNAKHSEVRHGERSGESPAVRNAERTSARGENYEQLYFRHPQPL